MFKTTCERYFKLSENGTSIKTEGLAGLATYSTMAYIIAVNPLILSQAGMDFGAVMVATILAASLSTLIMGLYANYPFAQAPGMGLNAYFAYGVVLGSGHSWQVALGASFIAGLGFLLLNLLNVRETIMHAIPSCLRLATTAGIGLFLAFIGLKNVGIIVDNPATLVSLGDMTSPKTYLSGLGIIVTVALMMRNYKAAILIGILMNWMIALATGLVPWQGIISWPPNIAPTFMQLNISNLFTPQLLGIVISFLFIAIFDTAGTLVGLAQQGQFLDQRGRLPRAKQALVTDAIGSMVGAAAGTSPMTTYLESASGIAIGGRTGLTSVVVALLFLLSLFFSPLIASIPLFATTPVLVVIGALMLKSLQGLKWDDLSELIPGFVVMVSIPLTFSIATGIGLGFLTYPLVKSLSGKRDEVHWLMWLLAGLFALKFALKL